MWTSILQPDYTKTNLRAEKINFIWRRSTWSWTFHELTINYSMISNYYLQSYYSLGPKVIRKTQRRKENRSYYSFCKCNILHTILYVKSPSPASQQPGECTVYRAVYSMRLVLTLLTGSCCLLWTVRFWPNSLSPSPRTGRVTSHVILHLLTTSYPWCWPEQFSQTRNTSKAKD